MHRAGLTALALLLLPSLAFPASADDGPGFRRTTPRAPLRVTPDRILFGVPHGRAWGIESRLLPVRTGGATVALDVALGDGSVREAFVRIAWYDRAHGRPPQLLTEDSAYVLAGVRRRVVLELHPPADAVAFRVRVLARVLDGTPSSRHDALAVSRVLVEPGVRPRPSFTRLR